MTAVAIGHPEVDRLTNVRAEARRYMTAAAPRSPDAHLLESDAGGHLFLPDGSRLFDADAQLFARFAAAIDTGHVGALLEETGVRGEPFVDDEPLESPPIH